jgi:hypothetical protein
MKSQSALKRSELFLQKRAGPVTPPKFGTYWKKHGAAKLSEIDPAEYPALLAEAEVLGNE